MSNLFRAGDSAWPLKQPFLGRARSRLDVELADAFCIRTFSTVFRILSAGPNSLRHRLDDNDRRRDIGGMDVDIFQMENALPSVIFNRSLVSS
jgi:hypothetical protein